MWNIPCTGAAGASFATASCLSAQLRDKNDYVNAVIGGALGGSLFGLGCEQWMKINTAVYLLFV